jgi:uncharacterized integral membrane protein
MEVTIAIPEWLFWVIGIPLGMVILFIFIMGVILCYHIIKHS